MKNFRKILALIIAAVMVAASAIPAFAAVSTEAVDLEEKAQAAVEKEQEQISLRVKVCANKGNWRNYPENSIEAVLNATADYVSVDIRVTKDGIPVLMEDETIDRTCVDKDGKAVSGKVSDYSFEELQKFSLRMGNGGPHNTKTDYKIPALSDVLAKTNGKELILDFELSDFDAVYNIISTSYKQTDVIFRINGKAKDVVDTLSGKESVPETILKYDGNIIFSVNDTIKTAKESGLHMVQLGDKNQYGVIFYQSVEDNIKENGLTAVFSMTDEYNAKRPDNISGWDDVISHGYSVIETDYPELLNTYVNESENVRQLLATLIGKNAEYESGSYPKNLKEEYTNAYNEAVSVSGGIASQSQLSQSYTRLNDACNALNLAEGTTTQQSALKISVGRIIAAVLCLAAVVAAQVYFYKRRIK